MCSQTSESFRLEVWANRLVIGTFGYIMLVLTIIHISLVDFLVRLFLSSALRY